MKQNLVILILSLLLATASGIIVYLYETNPVKGYYCVYEKENLKLFAKDTGSKREQALSYYEGGEHVPYEKGVRMIKQYRANRIKNADDSAKVTRFVSFDFDNVFAYMGYLLTEQSPDIPHDDLGFRVYFAENLERTANPRGDYYPETMLFAPTKKGHPFYAAFADKDWDFFNQGSICPSNCPDDDGEPLK